MFHKSQPACSRELARAREYLSEKFEPDWQEASASTYTLLSALENVCFCSVFIYALGL
jgi:hypothetical protein